MLVSSYRLLLSIQTYESKVWTKMSQLKQENKKLKVYYMPAPQTCLDYPKIEEGSNWPISVFSIMLLFLTFFSSSSSFAAILTWWDNHCLLRIVPIKGDIICKAFWALTLSLYPSLEQFHLSNSAACKWQPSVIFHLKDLLHHHWLYFLPQDWSKEKKWVEVGRV